MRTNLIKTKELPKVVEPSTTDGMLDMVIAFDTTGSMSAYINAVKTHVKELVPKLFSSNPDLRIGIVAFGDYCDMKSKDNFGKAYQVLNLLRYLLLCSKSRIKLRPRSNMKLKGKHKDKKL